MRIWALIVWGNLSSIQLAHNMKGSITISQQSIPALQGPHSWFHIPKDLLRLNGNPSILELKYQLETCKSQGRFKSWTNMYPDSQMEGLRICWMPFMARNCSRLYLKTWRSWFNEACYPWLMFKNTKGSFHIQSQMPGVQDFRKYLVQLKSQLDFGCEHVFM